MTGVASQRGSVVYVPILHGSLPFALAVREAFFRERPDCVAVELPETLIEPVQRAVRRLPLLSLLRYEAGETGAVFLLVEPCDGVFEALRLAAEHQVPAHLVDRDADGYPEHQDDLPDPYAMREIGYGAYADLVADALARGPRSPADQVREATMAFHVAELAARHRKVLFVCGLGHVARVRKRIEDGETGARPLGRTRRPGVQVFQVHEASSREVLSEPGYVQAAFERWRREYPAAIAPTKETDAYAMARGLFLSARDRMLKEDGERLGARELRIGLQFARNQALARRALAPDLFELTVAARGVASDDFAWHVWDLGVAYPHQPGAAVDLPVYRVTLEELQRGSKRLWFRRRVKTRRHALRLIRTRIPEPSPSAWGGKLDDPTLCSYPPEDVELESFGALWRRRAGSILAEEHSRVLPLSCGIADGIDVRETIRNYGHDGRVFVREERRDHGDAGALCMIFDPDDRAGRYGWTMTWQGEHDDESDMALYATTPHEKLIGPQIGRAEYGGFLMTYPPGRMFHVFEDPYFDVAETKAERLLYAAVDYCVGRIVLYIAPRAPRQKIVQFAKRTGKKIVYLPLGQLSPAKVRRIRVFHVLGSRATRAIARDYIGR